MNTSTPLSQALDRGNEENGTRLRLGIDVGGTTIKYAVVDTANGSLRSPLQQVPTPRPAAPGDVADVLERLVRELSFQPSAPDPASAVGVAFPSIVQSGVTRSAANVDDAWIGFDASRFLTDRLGCPVRMINDADAAGLAEVRYGAGRDTRGVVLVITLGTGIGSALIVNGQLVPNTELGHLEVNGHKAETKASAVARERDQLDWVEYAGRLQQYLTHVEFLFSPDLIIIGGGISARSNEYLPHLKLGTRIVPAQLHNSAGVVGAALHSAVVPGTCAGGGADTRESFERTTS